MRGCAIAIKTRDSGYPNKIRVQQRTRTGLIFARERKVGRSAFSRVVRVIRVLCNRYEYARDVCVYGTTRSGGDMRM